MILVLVAAFNEELGLAEVIPRVPSSIAGHAVEMLVLSDGSTDRTADVARGFGCRVIEFNDNRGKGAVLKSGLEAIKGESYDALVFMDADGQHDPAQLTEITGPILDGSADLVIGSRYKDGLGREHAPWNRYLVRCATHAVLDLVLSPDITDPYCGYRALTQDAARCIELHGDRYESELEMLFCAERGGLRVVEVPIPKLYGPNTSKMGSRYGAAFGRIDVVARYAYTILRETTRLALDRKPRSKDKIPS